MNVLLLIDRLGCGGAETHLLTLTAELCHNGCHVTVACRGGHWMARVSACGGRLMQFPAPLTVGHMIKNTRFVRALLQNEHFDVIHAHTRRTALLCRLATLRPLPIPLKARALTATYRRGGVRRATQPLRVVSAHAKFAPRCRLLSFWGDVTIAVSEDIRTHLRTRFGVPVQRICHIPNGIDFSLFTPSDAIRDPSVFRICFASRLDGDCALSAELLLTLAPRLTVACAARGRRLALTILGGGERFAAIQARAAKLNEQLGTSTVQTPGSADNPWRYFQAADAFVGVSRAAMEALGCGCAILLAGNEGYGGILNQHNLEHHLRSNLCCRGCPFPDEERLFSDLCSLLDTPPSALQAQSATLRAQLMQHCSAARMGEQTLALYCRELSRRRRLRVAVIGYFGRGNLGDEAILQSLIQELQGKSAPLSLAAATPQLRPIPTAALAPPITLQLLVLTARKKTHREPDSSAVGGLPSLPRGSQWRRPWVLLRTDALLFGGGTLLQNASRHGNLSLLYYLSSALLARICGCPFSLRANGIGPLCGWWARAAVGTVLGLSSGISLRDRASFCLLCRCGVSAHRLEFCPDPLLDARSEDEQSTRTRLASLGIAPERGYICVIPRPAAGTCITHLADVVRKESLDGALAVLVLSFCPEEDAPICRALAAALGSVSLPCDNVQVTAGILQHAQAVISTRLHGLILARATGQTAPLPRLIAFALPSAAPKLHAFLSEHGGVCINAPVTPKKQCCANKIDNTHCNFPGSMV